MSLNGLDDPKIVEAYEAVTTEPGSWFLVKYASRDEVELLSRGNGGIVEIRNAVEQYEETSPLYGVLKYRRRNVVVKYLPDGCSRLIQARVAVHFNAICERFSPYDTIFEIAVAGELRDTKLSAACSLHAASGSTSSNGSSHRKKRLGEIAEEDEDEQRATKRQSVVPDAEDQRPQSPAEAGLPVEPVTLNSELASSPEQRNFSGPTTSELPNFVGVEDDTPASPTDTEATRPDLFTYSSYPYTKPKVKLGPRPSVDSTGRPQTAGNFRPVSAIPAGFKLFGKGSKRSKDRDASSVASPTEETASIDFPATSDDSQRPSTSSGLPNQPPAMAASTSTKQTITPEKARLMKAMKLREKKKKQMLRDSVAPIVSPDTPTDDAEKAQDEAAETGEGNTEIEESLPAEVEKSGDAALLIKTDSAIAVEALPATVHADQTSDLTVSDSRPDSPVVASSEADQSTKASSVSESTDETVQDKEEVPTNDEGEATRSIDLADGVESIPTPEDATVAVGSAAPIVAQDSTETEAVDEASHELDSHVETMAEALVSHDSELMSADVPIVPETDASSTKETVSAAIESEREVATESEAGHIQIAHEKPLEEDSHEIVTIPTSKFSTYAGLSPVTSNSTVSKDPSSSITEASPPTNASAAELSNGEPKATPPRISAPNAQDLLAAAKAASQPTVVVAPVFVETPAIIPDTVVTDESIREHDDSDTETIPAKAENSKRKAWVQPIRTDIAQHSRQTSRTETHLSEDEDFMNELQSATVQEARPMTVSRTPKTPSFPESAKFPPPVPYGPTSHMVRTISNPVRGALIVPGDISQSSARSLSSGAAYLHKVTQQQTNGSLGMKPNVGSSISQRIKALEKLSATPGETVPTPPSRDRPSSTFFSVKKREPSKSPSVLDRAGSFRHRTPPSPSQSRESSPEASKITRRERRERSNSVASRLSMFESPPGPTRLGSSQGISPSISPGTRGRPESISVTAKIIRDPNHSFRQGLEPPRDPSEYSHLDLKQSPLLVDHQKAIREPTSVVAEPPTDQRSGSQDEGKSRRSSLSIMKDFIKERRKSITSSHTDLPSVGMTNEPRSPSRPGSIRQNSYSHRLSISSRRSLSKDRDNQMSPQAHQDSFGSSDDGKSYNGDKKKSRAERFMRRISTLSGARNKAATPPGLSPVVREEEPQPVRPATTAGITETPAIESYMGDVNVQFPDNLLWKRRNMTLDAKGFLVLSALAAQNGRPAQGTKRYHLSEFRAPYVPDVEVQELPNSVVLDFIEGTGVQVACEDRAGQTNVLRILQEAHARYSNI